MAENLYTLKLVLLKVACIHPKSELFAVGVQNRSRHTAVDELLRIQHKKEVHAEGEPDLHHLSREVAVGVRTRGCDGRTLGHGRVCRFVEVGETQLGGRELEGLGQRDHVIDREVLLSGESTLDRAAIETGPQRQLSGVEALFLDGGAEKCEQRLRWTGNQAASGQVQGEGRRRSVTVPLAFDGFVRRMASQRAPPISSTEPWPTTIRRVSPLMS